MIWSYLSLILLIQFNRTSTLKIGEAIQSLGWRFVNVLVEDVKDYHNIQNNCFAKCISILDSHNYESICGFDSVPSLFLMKQNISKSYLKSMEQCLESKASESILVVLQNHPSTRADFVEHLRNFEHSKSLFVLDQSSDQLQIVYTNRHKKQLVWNDIDNFEQPYHYMRIKRNLAGTILKDITLPWKPWLSIEQCHSKGFYDCKTTGLTF